MTLTRATPTDFKDAIAAFNAGKPVLIHDFDTREGETDMVYPAGAVTADDVCQMRNDAGGLICVALSDRVAKAFDLPFYAQQVDHPVTHDHDLEYDTRSSFSLTVNHRDTFTGITDADRAKTIQELGAAARNPEATDFTSEFRCPGHVHLLRAAPRLIEQRHGHTEFGLALAEAAGIEPSVVVCEMLDDETGFALPKEQAHQYAGQHDIPFLDGQCLFDMLAGIDRPYPNEYPTIGSRPYPNAEGPSAFEESSQ